jgi:hypothetical protein
MVYLLNMVDLSMAMLYNLRVAQASKQPRREKKHALVFFGMFWNVLE